MSQQNRMLSRDVALERAALSRIITGRSIPELRAEYFCGPERRLYDALSAQWHAFGEVDIVPIQDKHADTLAAVLECSGSLTPATIAELRRHYLSRELGLLLSRAAADEDTDPETILRDIQEGAGGLLVPHGYQQYDHQAVVEGVITEVEAGIGGRRDVRGYTTGVASLDRAISGFEHDRLYVLGALKKSGKSRFLVHLALQVMQAGGRVVICSLEMSPEQLLGCALANMSGVDTRHIGQGMTAAEATTVRAAYPQLRAIGWSIHRCHTVPELRASVAAECNRGGCDVVFVDYVQRLRDDRYRSDRTREVEAVAMGLADLSREQGVAVVALAQLAGRAEDLPADEIPSMRHLKESQGLAEAADVIMTMRNLDRDEDPFTADGSYRLPQLRILIEQRYGLSGVVVRMMADLRTCRFVEDRGP